jgi:hypothetical protein
MSVKDPRDQKSVAHRMNRGSRNPQPKGKSNPMRLPLMMKRREPRNSNRRRMGPIRKQWLPCRLNLLLWAFPAI